ncbi:MAG: SurA N-terminal domain-containing protein [Bdellovibrionales bacterium]|nr:SurA N-terminal domain-containing protein [Bdellovibrionales bacterium]
MKYLSLFLFSFCYLTSAQTIEKTLAIVETEMISLMDLKEAKKRLNRGFFEDSLLLTLFEPSQLKKTEAAFLNFLIYEKVLDLLVEQAELKIADAHLKQEINNRRKKRGLSKKAFSRYLVKNHFTSSSYKEFLKKDLLRRLFVQREIAEKIRFSDQDLNEYARQTQGTALFTSFEYELTYLFFPKTNRGKTRSKDISHLILKEASFFDKWEPKEKGEKKKVLKKIKLSSLHPTIKRAIKNLSTGQVSPVLSLPSGYHIFKVVWKTPVITDKNKKRKEKLFVLLFEALFKKRFKLWLEEKKNKTFIQINS